MLVMNKVSNPNIGEPGNFKLKRKFLMQKCLFPEDQPTFTFVIICPHLAVRERKANNTPPHSANATFARLTKTRLRQSGAPDDFYYNKVPQLNGTLVPEKEINCRALISYPSNGVQGKV
ncbi:hypothetical protein EVAR_16510_1 [Eumeta japonica]|uniref:Uncharacterized protein n=1 Tax=Eumeta variegata TaxID=151549 RepID=A0A4C1U2Z5_EUMVA|nr:hypothetical protein EVAR_16510_1 [Eumeta japonica]